jgi:hypothetical protein
MRLFSQVVPLARLVLLTTPLWAVIGYATFGWIGLGVMLMVIGAFLLGIAAMAPAARRAQPQLTRRTEEVVGALYPERMRHRHRQKGVCTLHCRPKDQVA